MKLTKIISLLIAALMLLSFASCGTESVQTDVESETEERNLPAEFTIDGFEMTYNGFDLTTDKFGNDAIAVYYTFKNTSDKPNGFGWAFICDMKQGNDDIFSTIVPVAEGSEEALGDSANVKLEPGETGDVVLTYSLKNTKTPVDVRLYSFFSIDEIFSHTIYLDKPFEADAAE